MAVGDDSDFSVQVGTDGAGGGTATLALAGELDAYAAEQLSAVIEQIDPTATALELDVQHVGFVDSSGLRVLLRAGDRVGGGKTVLRHPQPTLLRLLELTGLLEHFRLET